MLNSNDRLDLIQKFIEDNFNIVKTRKRTRDTLLNLKCPVCEDNKKPNNKNRVRASFIREPDLIRYNCFNCGNTYSISDRLNDLAYVLSKEQEVSYSTAKQRVAVLAPYYIEKPSESAYKKAQTYDMIEVSCPGRVIQIDGAKWLVERGFSDPEFFKQIKQIKNRIFIPFTIGGKCFGYQEIDINQKSYLNYTDPNDLNCYLIGLDDITPGTERLLVVESVIDAKLITQDSEGFVVGLSMAGSSLGPSRVSILTDQALPFILNPDNDPSGLKLIDHLKKEQPEWLGSLTPAPNKDYGEYRKSVGALVALSRLVGNAKPLHSAALQLMRIK